MISKNKETLSFSSLGINSKIIKALEENHYNCPSPIQEKAIPAIFTGKDIIACAQTGTGKTAAFSLPLIERIAQLKQRWRKTTVLVLSPTRELANQTAENIKKYSKYLPVRCTAVYGGVKMETQARIVKKGVQIVVATPGRLIDHIRNQSIDLSSVDTFVLDEADRMLDMGFARELHKIIAMLPRHGRQNLFFSATFSKHIQILMKEILFQPKIIQLSENNYSLENIEQSAYYIEKKFRKAWISEFINTKKFQQVLIFTQTKKEANNLAEFLNEQNIQSREFHSNKSQEMRTKTLDLFKNKKLRVLVATDVAARGIDVLSLPCVINFELPKLKDNYIHRIGRTGRAGKKGTAVSLYCNKDKQILLNLEASLKIKVKKYFL
jgi:ATP-dependent RNA helicase RhlE